VSSTVGCIGNFDFCGKDPSLIDTYRRAQVIWKSNAKPSAFRIRWFGQRSYELQLLHIVVLGILHEYVTRQYVGLYAKPLWLVFYLAAAALVAQIVFRYFSEPLNRLFRRGVLHSSAGYVR
jgi:peptidoglycan/LPS O-acetylase OafA/YrhL